MPRLIRASGRWLSFWRVWARTISAGTGDVRWRLFGSSGERFERTEEVAHSICTRSGAAFHEACMRALIGGAAAWPLDGLSALADPARYPTVAAAAAPKRRRSRTCETICHGAADVQSCDGRKRSVEYVVAISAPSCSGEAAKRRRETRPQRQRQRPAGERVPSLRPSIHDEVHCDREGDRRRREEADGRAEDTRTRIRHRDTGQGSARAQRAPPRAG